MLDQLLEKIVSSKYLHAKWLNTLSFLENCGARKIAAYEHPTLVKEEILKHASEEFRHAHYLKQQIKKIPNQLLEDYSLNSILGGYKTAHYIDQLDLLTSRYIKKTFQESLLKLKASAYLLVTYAIELRAEALYPLYESKLRKYHTNIYVKSIILEEQEHLEEMRSGINALNYPPHIIQTVCSIEQSIYSDWLFHIHQEIQAHWH